MLALTGLCLECHCLFVQNVIHLAHHKILYPETEPLNKENLDIRPEPGIIDQISIRPSAAFFI